MIKILFALNIIVIIVTLFFLRIGIKYYKNDECNIKGFKYIIVCSKVMAICIVLSAILFCPIFFGR